MDQGSQIRSSAEVFKRTKELRPAGTMRVSAADILLTDGAWISTKSEGKDIAGDIVVTSHSRLGLDGARYHDRSKGLRSRQHRGCCGRSDRSSRQPDHHLCGRRCRGGGDITIDSRFLVLDGSRIQANADEGSGGKIRISVGNLLQTPPPDSVMEANSERGIDGNIVIEAADTNLLLISPSCRRRFW
jgi:hypothetical protein